MKVRQRNDSGKNGQGALEYLLLIGGAVLVAGIVIVLILGISNSGQVSTTSSVNTIQNAEDERGGNGNLIANSGFENGMTGWKSDIWASSADITLISNSCASGSSCLKIGLDQQRDQEGVYQQIPTSQGAKYVLKGYCRGTGCRIGVQLFSDPNCLPSTGTGEEYDTYLNGSTNSWSVPQIKNPVDYGGSFLSLYPNPWIFKVQSSNAKCLRLYATNDGGSDNEYDVITLKPAQ